MLSLTSFARIALLALLIGAAGVSADEGEVFHGTWELNLKKSKFMPGPAPKNQTRIMSAKGDMHETVIRTVHADGTSTSSGARYRLDGKDYPVTESTEIDSVAFTKVDDHTSRGVLKRDGKVVSEVQRKVSKDGKTMTLTSKGTNQEGKPVNNVLVFDRK